MITWYTLLYGMIKLLALAGAYRSVYGRVPSCLLNIRANCLCAVLRPPVMSSKFFLVPSKTELRAPRYNE